MIKLLIGGSPCTRWSIAQKNGRETTPEGLGWELFRNYLIAKEKFKPDFFLYENNKSASQAIKSQIRTELGVWDGTFFTEDTGARYIEINSALVSAQNRQRFYVHNCGDLGQPEDRGILLRDILEGGVVDRQKAHCLKHQAGNARDCFKKSHTQIDFEPICLNSKSGRSGVEGLQPSLQDRIYSTDGKSTVVTTAFMPKIAVPIRVGKLTRSDGKIIYHQQSRIYSGDGKSTNLNANGGGQGAKTGLYAIPVETIERKNGKLIYEVKEGLVTIKGKQFPIKLADGFYNIRKLTVTECCRLQTLPDDYCRAVSPNQAYRGLGNGWTAEIIIFLLNGALKDVPRDEEIVVLSMYDGIGTGRYCLDKMGFTNVKYFAYEIDKYAKKVALSNYPDIVQMGDAFDLRDPDWTIGY